MASSSRETPETWLTRVVAWATTCCWLCLIVGGGLVFVADVAGDLPEDTA